jgi:hypothetical protein
MANRKGRGMKRVCRKLSYHPQVFLEGLTEKRRTDESSTGCLGAGIPQSVERLATGWTTEGSEFECW